MQLLGVEIAIKNGSELHVYHFDKIFDDLVLAVDSHHTLVVAPLVRPLLERLVLGGCQKLVEVTAVKLINLASQDKSLHEDVFLVIQERAKHLQRCVIRKL